MRAVDVRNVSLAWVGTRVLSFAAVGIAASTAGIGGGSDFVEMWNQWDTRWFESIATEGYVGTYLSDFEDFRYNVAFFPGLPMLMRLGVLGGVSPIAVGLVVSLIASWVAALALVRLVEQAGGTGWLASFAWIVAPTAVFLTAAYTEALFAAFAFWAWVWAKERSWWTAGILAALAALVRPNAIFLVVGLLVVFLMTKPRSLRDLLAGFPLLLPVVFMAGFFAYLRAITGSWTAWFDAQRDFWDRQLVDPWTSLSNTYQLISTFSPTGEPSSRMVSEILAMGILLVVLVALVVKRWWAEAVYSGATALSLGTSSMYYSIPRTLVLIFPLWVLMGLWLARAPWRPWVYGVACLPALMLITVLFTDGQWIS